MTRNPHPFPLRKKKYKTMTPNPQYNYRFTKLTLHFIEKSSQALLEVSPALYCSFKLFTKILKGSFYIWCKLSDPINQFCFNVLIYIRLLWSCDSSFPHLSRLLCGTNDLESGNKVTNTKSKSSQFKNSRQAGKPSFHKDKNRIVICSGSKNSSKSLFSRYAGFWRFPWWRKRY